ncbi:hypothetical protein DICPUDRAFT_155071 [Dictyostelium purpureum]|uniref:Complement Clr-like EGF domain-containing protein n=1 Tax=Dictyostelium purpureum TaxID=5786 RepID=F0ZT03_DICPU|nr:uncharacterized protein DICPUDRAFT_155071 [Dictyostelium purpureum]EGC32933.1 hypothetical protein DICPUDRAFT_155071 [Dictyostelium purpureum]|eukprot:XP_003290541.1 hypothetical protein DICPUDRAFT_155071 [Dictyostelium purpureum]
MKTPKILKISMNVKEVFQVVPKLCENTMGSFLCSCEPGYTLDADKKGCNDINECIDGGCYEQTCNNLMGS